jgi:hypothetical protein
MNAKERAFDRLAIPPGNRVVLSLDGGGIRGIMTLQLLKKIEEIAGVPCHNLFDMVAGTSTGGIIAGLIANGMTALEVETLYVRLVKQVFAQRNIFSHRYTNPPKYTKKNFRDILRNNLGDTTIADACAQTSTDILITGKDVAAGEETYFTCFQDNGIYEGTYKRILLRAAIEATMSAPTYFTPLERFVDGGTTTYGNPVLAAIMEAVRFGPKDKYSIDKMTVFSLGTGCRAQFIPPNQIIEPNGLDAYFWLQWLMTEASDDASDMQNFLLRSGVFKALDFRRFQISLDHEAISKLPNVQLHDLDDIRADWLHDLTDEELANIPLDKVSHFPLMHAIGKAMVDFIAIEQHPPFSADLIDEKRRDKLVSRRGDVNRIKVQMSNPEWVDGFIA